VHVISTLAGMTPALKGAVVAIGNFDGVHRGHRAVIEEAQAIAKGLQCPMIVLTFEPHPRTFFRPNEPVWRLTPPPLKHALLAKAGVDGLVELAFNSELAALDAGAFVSDVLVHGLGARHIVTGHDFHYGRGRSGSPFTLADAGKTNGFGVSIVEAFVDEGGQPVSSSRIREALRAGDVALAGGLLGRPFAVQSTIVHGDKRGRVLGFPTANMALAPETGIAHGIYAVRCEVDGKVHNGAANFGRRPQFGGGPVLLETFLFDFSGDLYGKTARVEFVAWLRPEQRFDSVEALIAQMDTDCAEARALLSAL
jgi:riboflavin kinase / FMN adenylyltransferase